MISTVLFKIALSTLIAFIFFVIIAEAFYGSGWHNKAAENSYGARLLGGLQILIFLSTFSAGLIFLVWGV